MLALFILLVLVASAAQGSRRNRGRSNQGSGTPGDFDFYILTLSWAPDFCAQTDPSRNARECGTGNHVGFIVHGLWPQKEAGEVPPCGPGRPVADDIVNRMLPIMMNAGLIQHEWRDHGTCSGLAPSAYFDTVRRAFSSIQIPAEFKSLNREMQTPPGDIAAKFAQANPGLPRGAFHAECKNDELSEVRICLTKDLKGRDCSISDCRTGTVRVLPTR